MDSEQKLSQHSCVVQFSVTHSEGNSAFGARPKSCGHWLSTHSPAQHSCGVQGSAAQVVFSFTPSIIAVWKWEQKRSEQRPSQHSWLAHSHPLQELGCSSTGFSGCFQVQKFSWHVPTQHSSALQGNPAHKLPLVSPSVKLRRTLPIAKAEEHMESWQVATQHSVGSQGKDLHVAGLSVSLLRVLPAGQAISGQVPKQHSASVQGCAWHRSGIMASSRGTD